MAPTKPLSRKAGLSSKGCMYLSLAALVYFLVFKNLQGLFVFTVQKTNEYDASLLPWLWDTSSSLPGHEGQGDVLPTIRARNSSAPVFHIYWLNEGREGYFSQQMGQKLEALFQQLQLSSGEPLSTIVTRIPWWTNEKVEEIYTNDTQKRLTLNNNITLKEIRNYPKAPHAYSFDQAARLLTHLEAIAKAHESKHDIVLFLEDGAVLTQSFVDYWWDYASLAPRDWTVLQWTTSNTPTLEQSLSIQEAWISWLPDLWGTHAYTMQRSGMEAIWQNVARERLLPTGEKAMYFTLDEKFNNIFLADELLFSVPQQIAYTSTYPWVPSDDIQKSVVTSKSLGATIDLFPPSLPLPSMTPPPQRTETLLVFMNIRFSTTQRMAREINRALLDLEAVCRFHNETKCDWIIHGVFTKDFLFQRFQTEYQHQLPPNVITFQTTIGDARFNKFAIVADHLEIMKNYDLVLVKDNDQRLAGFPWYSFLEKKGSALVAGPLRQAPDESFMRTKIWEISQHYKLHDSRGWKKKNFAPWSTPYFINATVIEVHFLEMFFNVFDGQFAEWFFSQILTKNFTDQDSCWGPDFMWCPAAQDYAKNTEKPDRMGCALVPFVSVHEDTRQIFKDGEEFNNRGYAAVENLRRSKKIFTKWYAHSWKYARGVIAWRQLDAISQQCRKIQKGVYKLRENIDFQSCIAAAMALKKMI